MFKLKDLFFLSIKQKFFLLYKLILSTIAIIVIYTNLAIIINYSPIQYKFPTFRLAHFLYSNFDVFSIGSKNNKECVIWALIKNVRKSESDGQWIQLDIEIFLPYKRGEIFRRMQCVAQFNSGGRRARYEARKFYAKKIREKYNREHPDQRIVKVAIGVAKWPKSRRGYTVIEKSDRIEHETIYMDE